MDDIKIIEIVKQLIENLILIPQGPFLMGTNPRDESADEDEFPQHLVTLQPFLIGKYPVTQQQWKAINHLSKVNIELPKDPSYDKGNNFPVAAITWHQALEFCDRLSGFTGLNITLPSESQWEYACRAGTTTKYYWEIILILI